MSRRQRLRRAAFFEAHPTCCFCGGSAPATEIDHIPARYLFRNRQWPVGYEFPACASCNDISADDELIMGLIVRIQISNLSYEDELELDRALTQLHDRHPQLVPKMKELSRIETRKMLRRQGLSPQSFPGSEIYVVNMPDELMDVPDRYGEKLGKALYYLHTGRIVPCCGGVRVKTLTNAQFFSPNFPMENFRILNKKPVLSRAGKSLEDQFTYQYAVPDDGGGAAFLVQFRESTAMVIFVFEDKKAHQLRMDARAANNNQSV